MREISINEVKDLQISILKDVVCFCEANNIRYFLAFGTLLGAIRHKGYIPWDDDIDICMPRPDYERFRILYRADIYEFVDIHNTPNFGLALGKVCDKRTVVKMQMFQTCEYGAYIDVFPIDAIGDNLQLLKTRILLQMLKIKKAKLKTGRSFIKDLCIGFCKLLLTPFSLRSLVLIIDNISKQKQYESRNAITCFSDEDWLKVRLPRNMFEEFIYAEFEGGQYRIPKDYTFYLEKMYGNYMELPPIEKRVSQHNMKVYWK